MTERPDERTLSWQPSRSPLPTSSPPLPTSDSILLYSQAGALAGPALEVLITKIKDLDMNAVRAEIAAQAETTDA